MRYSRELPGLFVVLEGLDGSGKTTIARALVDRLSQLGIEASYTYEPFDSAIVRAIKGDYAGLRDALVDALAYALDRLLHWKAEIEPVLARGGAVVCDRYFYSSAAYQAAGGAPFEWVLEVNRFAPRPDVAVYLDVEPELGLARKRGVGSRFPEYESLDFLRAVRGFYLRMVESGMLIPVDARRSLGEVLEEVWRLVLEALDKKRKRA